MVLEDWTIPRLSSSSESEKENKEDVPTNKSKRNIKEKAKEVTKKRKPTVTEEVDEDKKEEKKKKRKPTVKDGEKSKEGDKKKRKPATKTDEEGKGNGKKKRKPTDEKSKEEVQKKRKPALKEKANADAKEERTVKRARNGRKKKDQDLPIPSSSTANVFESPLHFQTSKIKMKPENVREGVSFNRSNADTTNQQSTSRRPNGDSMYGAFGADDPIEREFRTSYYLRNVRCPVSYKY
ncbi:unnamed protein product [Bursaphelenchus okinawaensis]|uniref:Uncharacterized protein n=1 Tax=Bursaphelenchus okinawaensis TaxID=465554 RepID=A0A811LAV8_9BILA|nr:unnamed protein product [Bursaphelenchus okinawaensis]CAG9120741.1 unnamed protein product [Bursaphelenchus okinawaensis]